MCLRFVTRPIFLAHYCFLPRLHFCAHPVRGRLHERSRDGPRMRHRKEGERCRSGRCQPSPQHHFASRHGALSEFIILFSPVAWSDAALMPFGHRRWTGPSAALPRMFSSSKFPSWLALEVRARSNFYSTRADVSGLQVGVTPFGDSCSLLEHNLVVS